MTFEGFTGEVALKIVESSGLKSVDVLSYFAIKFFNSRIVFFWCTICMACWSFFKFSFLKWLRIIGLNSSNSWLLMQSIDPTLFRTKQKTKATENCVIIVQYHQYPMFVYDYLCFSNLLWLCKTKFLPSFSPSIDKHFIMTPNIVDVPLYMF